MSSHRRGGGKIRLHHHNLHCESGRWIFKLVRIRVLEQTVVTRQYLVPSVNTSAADWTR